MSKCTDQESIYSDIVFCRGKKSLPGVRGTVYGISKRDILSWPLIGSQKKTPDADLSTVAVYEGDFVLAGDKKWHVIGMIPNEGQIQDESQGSYGSKSFKNTATIVIPGTEEEVSGYIAEANNDEMVYLVVQRNGKARVIGSEAFTPELSLSQDTGKAATDANSTTVSAVADDEYPAPFYHGKIETEDGDISGETGLKIAAEHA